MNVVVSVIFAAYAVVIAVFLVTAIWSLSWPSVKGKVEISFHDAQSELAVEDGKFYRRNKEDHVLCYSYTVDGIEYKGTNIKPFETSWSLRGGGSDHLDSGTILWSGARDTAKWYRPGVIVDVHYCPLRPQWSCLEPGGILIAVFMGVMGAVIFLAAR